MTKLSKDILAYFLAIIIEAFIGLTLLSTISEKYTFDLYWFFYVLLAVTILLSPFIVLSIIAHKKKKVILQGVSKGFIIWLFIAWIPLSIGSLLTLSFESNIYVLFFGLIEILMGGYIIQHYRLPKHFILLAVILPGLANLYLLIYGIIKNIRGT